MRCEDYPCCGHQDTCDMSDNTDWYAVLERKQANEAKWDNCDDEDCEVTGVCVC